MNLLCTTDEPIFSDIRRGDILEHIVGYFLKNIIHFILRKLIIKISDIV